MKKWRLNERKLKNKVFEREIKVNFKKTSEKYGGSLTLLTNYGNKKQKKLTKNSEEISRQK